MAGPLDHFGRRGRRAALGAEAREPPPEAAALRGAGYVGLGLGALAGALAWRDYWFAAAVVCGLVGRSAGRYVARAVAEADFPVEASR